MDAKKFASTSSLFIVLILALAGSPLAQNAADFISQGDSAYRSFDNKLALTDYSKALKADSTNYEAAWKLSRAYVDVGETFENKDRRKEIYKKGEDFARQAIRIDSTGEKGHLSLSIALGRVALDAGAKERIRLSKEIKSELDKALKLNPNDDVAWHVLGRWHRKISTLNWIEKKFANMFLGGVPKEASLEKAVECFKKAIELNPGHINHHLQLAITYEKIGDKEKAKEQYQKVLEMPKTDSDDDNHKQVARERLEDLS
jgi:tetratricopeptide (TPR) repeat protein